MRTVVKEQYENTYKGEQTKSDCPLSGGERSFQGNTCNRKDLYYYMKGAHK